VLAKTKNEPTTDEAKELLEKTKAEVCLLVIFLSDISLMVRCQ